MSFLSILKFIGIILEVLLIFNLVIIVHELGHFLAARWRGLVVEEFGVWFGKPIWRRKIGNVYYSLGSIPAGGFVKLPQMAPMETLEGESETPQAEMKPVAPLDKIITAFAGPLFSFLLALALGTITWAIGTPTSQPDTTTEIGSVLKGGPADRAGLKIGDSIKAIDGKPVTRFIGPTRSVIWGIVASEGDTIDFLIERGGQEMHIISGFEKESVSAWRRKSLRKVQIGPRWIPEVAETDKGSVAQQVGLKEGDVVLTANGKSIYSLGELQDVIKADHAQPLALVVQRGEAQVNITVPPLPPENGNAPFDIPGIAWGRFKLSHPTPFEQVGDSVRAIRNMIGAALSPKGDIGIQSFSGPIGIMNVYRRILEVDDGWRLAIAFSVFFNVNLALVNMLPFPVLDGGHITLAAIEAVRRRPVNARFMEIMQTACALLLVGFLVFVSFFDIGDMVPKGKSAAAPADPKPAIIEPAQPAATP